MMQKGMMGTKREDTSFGPIPGTLHMLILQTLARGGAQHGYGIAHHIRQTTDGVLQVEEGALYPALQRMLANGWVTAEWRLSDNNRRARFYSLTPDGRGQLRAEVNQFERMVRAIVQIIRPQATEA
jgi:PadR family transcriptional regulator, regulatory protein PadR